MTPLEAARQWVIDGGGNFQEGGPLDGHYLCRDCGRHICHWEIPAPGQCEVNDGHAETCMYGAATAIVTALEVGVTMANRMARQMYCNGCGGTSDESGGLDRADRHVATCERWAFISALRGEVVS